MRLRALLSPERVFLRLPSSGRDAFLSAVAERLARAASLGDAERLAAKLVEREELGTTALGGGVAVPHCKLGGLDEPLLAVAVTASPGIDFSAEDERPVRLSFFLVSPESSPVAHLKALAAISHRLQEEGLAKSLVAARSVPRLLELLEPDDPGGSGAGEGAAGSAAP